MTDQNEPEEAISEEATKPAPTESAAGTTAPASSRESGGDDELPYIDDPISKWWIAIIVAVFAMIFAFAIFFGSGGLLGDILDNGESSSTAEATLVASPSPSAEVSPSPVPAEDTSEPSGQASEAPTTEPTVEPTAEPTPEPTAEPTPEPTAEPTPEPTAEPTPEPTPEPSIGPCPTFDPGVSPMPLESEMPSPVPCFTPQPSASQASS